MDPHWTGAQQPNPVAVLEHEARLSEVLLPVRRGVLVAEGVRDEATDLSMLGDVLLSIEGNCLLVPGNFGSGSIFAGDGNLGTYTSGARELMVGLKGPREASVPTHLALSTVLHQRVEELSSGVLHSSIAPGHVGHRLCLVHPL